MASRGTWATSPGILAPMATFCLVHGAWHGAWCWEPLVGELDALGHEGVAVELPSHDPAAGLADYAAVAAPAAREADVVVGHSLGGLTIPLVPARRLVYLCALLPEPGRSLADQLQAEPRMMFDPPGRSRDDLNRSFWIDRDDAIETLYHDLDRDEAERVVSLLRPQGRRPSIEAWPLDRLPGVPSAYVLCRDDRLVAPEWSRRAARERLGVEARELPGGHSPMLARPAELARLLVEQLLEP